MRRGTTPTRKRTPKAAPAARRMRRTRRTGMAGGAGMTAGSGTLIGSPSLALIAILRSRSCAQLLGEFGHRLLAAEHAVDHGHEDERGDGREHEAADDDAAEGRVLLAALAETERHRQHAENHREGGHDDRAEAGGPRGHRRVVGVELLLLALLVGELDDQDRGAGRDAEARY